MEWSITLSMKDYWRGSKDLKENPFFKSRFKVETYLGRRMTSGYVKSGLG